jgi:zinc ribbon protein
MNSDQTTFCPQCGSEVFSGEKFCSSCGASLTKDQAALSPQATPAPAVGNPIWNWLNKPLPKAKAPKQSTLADSFILGAFGSLIKWSGFLVIFPGSLIAMAAGDGNTGVLCFFSGIAMVVGGSYCKYVAQHSMRISR